MYSHDIRDITMPPLPTTGTVIYCIQGTTAHLAQDEFTEGYHQGVHAYTNTATPPSEEQVDTIITYASHDTSHSIEWNAGFLAGYLTTHNEAHGEPEVTILPRSAQGIIVQDNQYAQGHRQGYADYYAMYHEQPLSDEHIYTMLTGALLDAAHPTRWSAGYVIGWTRALHETRPAITCGAERSTHQRRKTR